MEPLFDLPRDQFLAALAELQLDPERRDDLVRQYRRANSPFAPIYGLLERTAAEDAGEGMQRASMLPVARPEGMSVAEAVRAGEAQFAVPQSLLEAFGGVAQAVDAPAAAGQGLIPADDMVAEALNVGGVGMGAGGLAAAPSGALRAYALRGGGTSDPTNLGWNFRDVRPLDMGRENWRRFNNFEIAPRQEVLPIRSMYATQGRVNPDFATTSSSAGELPVVVRYGDEFYVTDGHHRLSKLAEEGRQNARVNLYDIDRTGPPETPLLDFNPEQYARNQREMEAIFDELGDLDDWLAQNDLAANRSTTTGLLAASAETPAQQIARLLREGRAADVTDDLMAQADPQEMYQLYVSGETGMDLPMDEASRMARAAEMGLRPEYHGTTTGSEMTYADAFRGSGSRQGIGFVTSDSPYVASTYADPSFGAVFPMLNPVLPENAPRIDVGGNVWSDISVDTPVRLGDRAVTARQLTYEPADVGGVLSTNQLSRGASFDYPGIEFSNILDRSIHAPRPPSDDGMNLMREFQERASEPSTVTMRHDTRGMRSRFARLDPRLSHLRNFNAANIDPLTGAAAMGASQQQQDPLANLRAYLAQNGLLSQ